MKTIDAEAAAAVNGGLIPLSWVKKVIDAIKAYCDANPVQCLPEPELKNPF
jgi:hypothetical protein